MAILLYEDVNQSSHKRMKPGHLDTASKTGLGHINTMFYWLINLKMNVDYKTISICGQPILDCIVAYLVMDHKSFKIDDFITKVQLEQGLVSCSNLQVKC